MKKYTKHLFTIAAIMLTALFTLPSITNAVPVKHRGDRSLSSYQCYSIQSSFIRQLCYRDDSVLASLSSTWYEYCGMSSRTFQEWLSAPSKGRYYNTNIKYQYSCPSAQSKPEIERPGCCSHHGGVCGCSLGTVTCCDGWTKSTCQC